MTTDRTLVALHGVVDRLDGDEARIVQATPVISRGDALAALVGRQRTPTPIPPDDVAFIDEPVEVPEDAVIWAIGSRFLRDSERTPKLQALLDSSARLSATAKAGGSTARVGIGSADDLTLLVERASGVLLDAFWAHLAGGRRSPARVRRLARLMRGLPLNDSRHAHINRLLFARYSAHAQDYCLLLDEAVLDGTFSSADEATAYLDWLEREALRGIGNGDRGASEAVQTPAVAAMPAGHEARMRSLEARVARLEHRNTANPFAKSAFRPPNPRAVHGSNFTWEMERQSR